MNKYLYLIFCLILFSCGKNSEPSNEELLAEAIKTAPWQGEETTDIETDDERKSVVLLIDSLMLDLEKPNTFNKIFFEKNSKEISSTTSDFDLTNISSLGGFIDWKGQLIHTVYDEIDSTDSFGVVDKTNSIYKFYSFISANYSINGTLNLKKTESMGAFGRYTNSRVIDGGISYKNSEGVRNITLHIEFNHEITSVITKTFTAIVNGVEIEGDLDVE